MFRAMRVRAAGVVAVMMLAGAAQAADMPGLPPALPAPAPPPPASIWVNSGWYVRGDLGWRWGMIGDAEASGGLAAPSDNKLSNGLTGGVGVGIRSRVLRTDVTFDYAAPVSYTGSAPDASAKVSSMNFLFNGYLDLGTWSRFTPYIGAGAGVALVKLSDFESATLPFSTSAHSEWNFAYAGMAGVAWAIAPNVQIDFGYRYLNVGTASTDSNAAGAFRLKNVAGHEVRVGLRWSFDDLREFH